MNSVTAALHGVFVWRDQRGPEHSGAGSLVVLCPLSVHSFLVYLQGPICESFLFQPYGALR